MNETNQKKTINCVLAQTNFKLKCSSAHDCRFVNIAQLDDQFKPISERKMFNNNWISRNSCESL